MNTSINSSVINASNISLSISDYDNLEYRKLLKIICDYISIASVAMIMLSMGADIYVKQVFNHIRRPLALITAMFCQFFMMPFFGFALIKVLNLQGAYAITILLVSCCPGGAVSNIFTYFIDGDVSLSKTMTSISSLLDLGTMPLNFWIYGHFADMNGFVIPYKQMTVSLALVTVPALVGAMIRWKFLRVAQFLTKIGTLFSLLVIVTVITLTNVAYPCIMLHISLKLLVAAVALPSSGIVMGYILSCLVCQESTIRKTIAIESGIQNVAIAIAILALSPFPFEIQGILLIFPIMYGISMISICLGLSTVYHIWKKFFQSKAAEENDSTTKSWPDVVKNFSFNKSATYHVKS